jgi:hypothetical protein
VDSLVIDVIGNQGPQIFPLRACDDAIVNSGSEASHPHSVSGRPVMRFERLLRLGGRGDRASSRREGEEEGVALSIDPFAVPLREDRSQELVEPSISEKRSVASLPTRKCSADRTGGAVGVWS